MDEDLSFSVFEKAKAEIVVFLATSNNEAETRLRAIDEILFSVLGWDKGNVEVEKYCRATGFSDYYLKDESGHPVAIIEAKKCDASFVLNDRVIPNRPYSLGYLANECPAARDALVQALGYAASLGCRYVAITNGHQWIIGLTFEQKPLESRFVYAFESLDAIQKRFRKFWQAFSPVGMTGNALLRELSHVEERPAPEKPSVRIPGYPQSSDRNAYVNELTYVLDLVWQKMGQSEGDEDFLRKCYVPPKSHDDIIALSREIIDRRRRVDEDIGGNVVPSNDLLKVAGTSEFERPIVLLGEIGHGKTTLLRYIRQIEAKEQLKGYIQLELDFLDRPDSEGDIPHYIYSEVEEQLREKYQIDINEHAFVKGVLFGEIQRFKSSYRGQAHLGDEVRFREEEVKLIEGIIADKHKYLEKVFAHLKKGRGKSLAIFFDNLDRRSDEIQEEAFLRASATARDWQCLVFITLRPSTYYRSVSQGVLDSLAPKIIAVSSPDPALMLKRRFVYAAQMAEGKATADIPFGREVSLSLPTAGSIFRSMELSARKDRGIIPMLEAASNGNMRKLLEFTKQILTSGHLDTKKIVELIKENDRYTMMSHEGEKTLLYGDYRQYDPGTSIFVNLFDLTHADPREHFLSMLILDYFGRFAVDQVTRGFSKVRDLYSYLESFGFTVPVIDAYLARLYHRECIQGPVPGDKWTEGILKYRITSHGRYHIYNLVRSFQYVDAVVIDTPILEAGLRLSISAHERIRDRLDQTERFTQYLDSCSKGLAGIDAFSLWGETVVAIREDIVRVRQSLPP